jgi:hypothetical protein
MDQYRESFAVQLGLNTVVGNVTALPRNANATSQKAAA